MTNNGMPLSLTIGRILTAPDRPQKLALDGLALSYRPGSALDAPTLAAGRFGRLPYAGEQADILNTLRRCTGRGIVASNRLDRPRGYHIIEYAWTIPEPEPEPEPGTTAYQIIRYTSNGVPYSAGIHTDRGEIERMAGRQSGRRDIVEFVIYPQPVKIHYGMKPIRR